MNSFVKQKMSRNGDYARANRPYFVINEDLCRQLKLDEASLFQYLYYHTISQQKARENV